MPIWLEIEQKLGGDGRRPRPRDCNASSSARNYFGQTAELDNQGRVLIHQRLRESADMTGEVDVVGNFDYLEVWNHERLASKLEHEPFTDEDMWASSRAGVERDCAGWCSHAAGRQADGASAAHARARPGDARGSRGGSRAGARRSCSSTARSASAATRRPCSRPERPACIGIDRDADALAVARERLAAWGDRVELVHADYRQLRRGARRARHRPGGRHPGRTSASRRCSSTPPAAASASSATSRSTCGWTGRPARRRRTWSPRSRSGSSPT